MEYVRSLRIDYSEIPKFNSNSIFASILIEILQTGSMKITDKISYTRISKKSPGVYRLPGCGPVGLLEVFKIIYDTNRLCGDIDKRPYYCGILKMYL